MTVLERIAVLLVTVAMVIGCVFLIRSEEETMRIRRDENYRNIATQNFLENNFSEEEYIHPLTEESKLFVSSIDEQQKRKYHVVIFLENETEIKVLEWDYEPKNQSTQGREYLFDAVMSNKTIAELAPEGGASNIKVKGLALLWGEGDNSCFLLDRDADGLWDIASKDRIIFREGSGEYGFTTKNGKSYRFITSPGINNPEVIRLEGGEKTDEVEKLLLGTDS